MYFLGGTEEDYENPLVSLCFGCHSNCAPPDKHNPLSQLPPRRTRAQAKCLMPTQREWPQYRGLGLCECRFSCPLCRGNPALLGDEKCFFFLCRAFERKYVYAPQKKITNKTSREHQRFSPMCLTSILKAVAA
jgi:hypothetical protein